MPEPGRHVAHRLLPGAYRDSLVLMQLQQRLEALAEATDRFRDAAFDYEAARCLSLAARVRTERANPGDEEKAAQARQEAERIFEELEVAS